MYGEERYSGVVAVGKTTLTITISPGARDRVWTVSQVSIEMATAPAGSTCNLRKNGSLVTAMVATGDVAGGDPPVVLIGGQTMTVEWAGVVAGATGSVFIIFDDGRPA